MVAPSLTHVFHVHKKMAEDEKKKEAEDAAQAPIPEKVSTQRCWCWVFRSIRDHTQIIAYSSFSSLISSLLQVQVGGSPVYIVDKKLGKGGFGQVYLGKRAQTTKEKEGINANQVMWELLL